MLSNLSRYWWLVALRGIAAIVFGFLAFIWPGPTLGALVILFGAYVLVDGVISLITGISDRNSNERWWVMTLEGLVGIAAGILTFVYPGITAVILLYFIAIWALLTGVLEIVAAVRLRQEIEGEWAFALSGIFSILFGVALFFFPGAGALAVVWLIGAYAILFGALLVYLGIKLRGMDKVEERRELRHA